MEDCLQQSRRHTRDHEAHDVSGQTQRPAGQRAKVSTISQDHPIRADHGHSHRDHRHLPNETVQYIHEKRSESSRRLPSRVQGGPHVEDDRGRSGEDGGVIRGLPRHVGYRIPTVCNTNSAVCLLLRWFSLSQSCQDSDASPRGTRAAGQGQKVSRDD
ncbi:hypothetical protein PENTCL1PPCAC_12773 [Pristionchus entomophagus]|uniref:Uncharacterized protein n=1 Tax=Pristionchus entomophagus TaxID=358040 RepID=A0AAV5TCT5_9BILA|nr:hypothetical protein PENTCL1PPCAC_12773 [Pristionchus entomophagus]